MGPKNMQDLVSTEETCHFGQKRCTVKVDHNSSGGSRFTELLFVEVVNCPLSTLEALEDFQISRSPPPAAATNSRSLSVTM
ncbi:hypothetical protein EVAR_86000_1 [Eumeta japonica]|uniref:Uncharacterized protein n=1 Tax=Eumeta variegata TaxID=151549 RepID=A0A4C1UJ99_EUMVA|nr:hypothetical protein EVAR_86000_1 [Eumeta japonica]